MYSTDKFSIAITNGDNYSYPLPFVLLWESCNDIYQINKATSTRGVSGYYWVQTDSGTAHAGIVI